MSFGRKTIREIYAPFVTSTESASAGEPSPAVYRIEAVAIVVSTISMNVGTTTAVATYQGLTAG